MANNRNNSGCSLIILILLGIYIAYEYYVVTPKQDAKELQEQIEFWGKSSVEYFNSFECDNLDQTDLKTDIDYFFVLFSDRGEKCKINSYIIQNFEKNTLINNYYTRDIDKANVIVWLEIIPGIMEGEYTNGASAIRNQVELKLIDKESKAIYWTEKFNALGDAREEIKRKGGDKRPEYFGRVPYDDIIHFLISEIKSSAGTL